MKCPNCTGVELVPRQVKGSVMTLYCCTQCKGIWFHRGQMELVVPGVVKSLAVPRDARLGTRQCPDCVQPMRVFYYPQTIVEIDMCKRCLGLWIDVGEAREISLVRRSVKSEAQEPDTVPGTKGQVIDLVNKALDWVMHSY